MTIAQAEKISGYRIERLSRTGKLPAEFAAYDDEDKLLDQVKCGIGETPALKMLIEKLYAIEGAIVYANQDGRCKDCARPLTLTTMERHHVIPRSRGRRDRGNLDGLCRACHRERHRSGYL